MVTAARRYLRAWICTISRIDAMGTSTEGFPPVTWTSAAAGSGVRAGDAAFVLERLIM